MEQSATNRFQLLNLMPPSAVPNCSGNGMISQAMHGRTTIPSVQNSSIQQRIFSRYAVGWNSPRYGKQMPMAPVMLDNEKNTVVW